MATLEVATKSVLREMEAGSTPRLREGREFGGGDADESSQRAMSCPSREGDYRNIGPDGAVFDHWFPEPTFR